MTRSPYLLPCLFTLLLLGGCATAPPSDPGDICAIFREKPSWYGSALDMQKKWGVPPQIAFAVLYQESSYRSDALPPRDWLLGIIPWGRVSSAYGYAQAKDDTWADYKNETGNGGSRDDMDAALNFMGWYMDKAQKLDGISKWDAYGQYLAYHEGWGGYRQRTYLSKPWLMRVAGVVRARSDRYGAQLRSCQADLSTGSWWPF